MTEFSFDLWSIGRFSIGERIEEDIVGITEKSFPEKGYSINLLNGVVNNIFFSFSGYAKHAEFTGGFKKNGKSVKISNRLSPEQAIKIFGEPESFWDDDVEINVKFSIDGHRIELSWESSSKTLNYINIE